MMKKRLFQIFCVLAATLILAFSPTQQLIAQADITPTPGCEEKPFTLADLEKYGNKPFQNPKSISSENGVLTTTLEVKYANNPIAGCNVNLRSYNGDLVGPTLRVKPNDLIDINLINSLPPETSPPPPNENTPHGFNTTNFHSHGLHVSPSGESDNVLRSMPPKTNDGDPAPTYPVKIQLPEVHPAGTYWYHAHRHGSTALQVSSGMGGALIVEGGLDQVPEIKNAKEKIFVFQQIAYNAQGEINDYSRFGPNDWQTSGRHTTINGQIFPKITMRPGEVQRWRFIHAGVRDSLFLQLVPVTPRNAKSTPALKLNEIAVDGIALGKIDPWTVLELEPGYRSDVLVQIPINLSPQVYYLQDNPTPKGKSLLSPKNGETGQILAKVVIAGEPVNMSLPGAKQLLAVKQSDAPPDITNATTGNTCEYTKDDAGTTGVGNGNKCARFNIDVNVSPAKFTVNGEPFSKDETPISLKLGTADVWTLSSDFVNHPFHIHVNPFQYTRKDPNNNDEEIWRDTLLIREHEPQTIKSQYAKFTGEFVLHCHILDHEDQGMMRLVTIEQ